MQNCKGYIGVVYRPPSLHSTEFEKFLSDFDKRLSKTASTNSLFSIILGEFNARTLFWWKEDKTTTEGTHLEALTSFHNFHQLVSDPIHLLPHSNACIDLIFTDRPILVVNCGTKSSLNSNAIFRLHIVNLISILNIPVHMNGWLGITKKHTLITSKVQLNQ